MTRLIERFIVGTLPGQYPIAGTAVLQDSLFHNSRVEWVQLNDSSVNPSIYTHTPSNWQLSFNQNLHDNDEILVSVVKL